MADSADVLLARVRAASRRTFASSGLDDRRAVEAFAELDLLLSAGGPLPTDWISAADRTVTDIPGPDAPLTVKRLLNEPGLIQGIADPAIRETLGIRER